MGAEISKLAIGERAQFVVRAVRVESTMGVSLAHHA